MGSEQFFSPRKVFDADLKKSLNIFFSIPIYRDIKALKLFNNRNLKKFDKLFKFILKLKYYWETSYFVFILTKNKTEI